MSDRIAVLEQYVWDIAKAQHDLEGAGDFITHDQLVELCRGEARKRFKQIMEVDDERGVFDPKSSRNELGQLANFLFEDDELAVLDQLRQERRASNKKWGPS